MEVEKVAKLKIADKNAPQPVLKHGRWRRYVLWMVVLSVLAGAGYAAYDQGLLTPAKSVQVAPVARVYPSQVVTDLSASGYVVAQRRAAVASKGTGRIEYLGVREGSRVKAGQVLARLEKDDLEAEKAQAEAQLDAARSSLDQAETELRTADRNFKRMKGFVHGGAVSQTDIDASEDRYLKGKAAVESARANIKVLEASVKRVGVLISYTAIRAPFDGVVLTKDAEVGEVVAPFGSATSAKAAVVTMADMSSLMVHADVSEASLTKVRVGQPCEIQLDLLPDTRFSGKVDTILPTADRTRGTVLAKVSFDNLDPRILPEMSARVAFLSKPLTEEENKPVLGAHRDSLAKRGSRHGVFQLEGDHVRWVSVASPEFMGDYLLLASSMKGGEKVVLKPSADLEDGDRIKIAE
ncbi:MAG: efflux RND transporter periplasmic adaptor subunit [Acidobacteriota bacterium]